MGHADHGSDERPWAHWRRDLVRVPGLLSLARVPLAVAFPLVVHDPVSALAIVAASAVTDVLDGWYARTFDQTTATGTVLDPLADKVFVASVLVTLVVTRALSPLGAAVLFTRELGEIPLVIWSARRAGPIAHDAAPPRANLAGKLTTGLQFLTIIAAILHSRACTPLLVATAIAGALAAASYWHRAVVRARTRANR